jgi:hypothetical protein
VFWINVDQDKEIIISEAIKVILLFAITCLCKTAFSALSATKIKFQPDISHSMAYAAGAFNKTML